VANEPSDLPDDVDALRALLLAEPQEHLAAFQGFMHSDAYSGYAKLYAPRDGPTPKITHVACMAHARRYFFDVYEATKSKIAAEDWSNLRDRSSNQRQNGC
jgi:Transposase IS66 family